MALSRSLLPEFDYEMANTRKTIERIPDDKLDYKPHEKSMTMMHLGSHLANIVTWGSHAINKDSIDLAPPGAPPARTPQAGSRQELLEIFDKNLADARAALESASDEHLLKPWSLLMGERTIFTMPRVAVIRTMVLNHTIHHRAQLGVYLRLNDIAVPSLYGPSADEGNL